VSDTTSGAERRPGSKARWTVLLALTALAVAGSAGGALVLTGGTGNSVPVTRRPESTVLVTKTDLVETQQVGGTLGHAGSHSVMAGKGGTVTWLPQPGDTITRGRQVYRRDNQQVPLLYGATPFWRELAGGVTNGPDVRILEDNLRAIGYGSNLTVDTAFTAATAAAIRKWQKKRGAEQTGRLELGDAVVLPGPIRVAEVKAKAGAPAVGEILTATGTDKQVVVDLPVTRSALAVRGSTVSIELPDGKSTTGKITTVGATATRSGNDGEGQDTRGDDDATLPVTVTLDRPGATGALEGAPVTVVLRGTTHKGVLTVPVNALLALAEGGYGVETVAGDGTKKIVKVDLGVFATGRVQITGPGLVAGMKVGVPAA
jgi:peptidoglycan hydrolase-like protein with peptidoglycan-binding domain